MNIAYSNSTDLSFFFDAKEQFDLLITELQSELFSNKEHGAIECYIDKQGNELLRRLFQGYLNLNAANECTQSVTSSQGGDPLNHVRKRTTRTLTSQFGNVVITRKVHS